MRQHALRDGSSSLLVCRTGNITTALCLLDTIHPESIIVAKVQCRFDEHPISRHQGLRCGVGPGTPQHKGTNAGSGGECYSQLVCA